MKIFHTLLAVAMLLTGCATTYQAHEVETTGFLNDYSKLQEGKAYEFIIIPTYFSYVKNILK
jgi:PBP1b-binding outer membrane lipoprotein LpoB